MVQAKEMQQIPVREALHMCCVMWSLVGVLMQGQATEMALTLDA